MTILETHYKQPAEVLDYDITYGQQDLPDGDSLSSATVAIVCTTNPLDTGLTQGAVIVSPTRVKVWLGGGSGPGPTKYKVTVKAVSAGGRTFEDEFYVVIKES